MITSDGKETIMNKKTVVEAIVRELVTFGDDRGYTALDLLGVGTIEPGTLERNHAAGVVKWHADAETLDADALRSDVVTYIRDHADNDLVDE